MLEVSSGLVLDVNGPRDLRPALRVSPVLTPGLKVFLDLVLDRKWSFGLILDLRDFGTDLTGNLDLVACLLPNFQTEIAG